jgi:soluble lytic murein transglycosylase-like protein
MKLRARLVLAGIGGLVMLPVQRALAAERVYLRSGFDLVCDHQQSRNGWTRLYLTPAGDDFLDVAPADIVRTEAVPATDQPSAIATQRQTATRPAVAAPLDLPALLGRAGARHRLDPDLLASVVRAESGGRTRAVSRAGAQGLMQLMPSTAAVLGVRDSFAPEQNVAGGAAYLDALLTYYHENIALALAAYNAGPAAVDRYRGIPPYAETRRYVQRVIHDFNRRKLQEALRSAPRFSQVSSLAATR